MEDCNIAIIGSGAAGLMAAIEASPAGGCLLLTDGTLGRSNSAMAQGGLQLPRRDPRSLEAFCEDIYRSARVEVDAQRVRNFVAHVAEVIETLARWGLQLDRDQRGELVRRMAGGLSEPRIVSVRDQIGPALMRVLLHKLEACPVDRLEHAQVLDIRREGTRLVIEGERAGRPLRLRARRVICCTGGPTWREARRRGLPTTNPPNHNHILFDRLAARGLPLVHPDFYQYQPFGIVRSAGEKVGRCVPESIVNLGVRLLDREGRDIGSLRRDRWELTCHLFELSRQGRAVQTEHGPGFRMTLSEVDGGQLAREFPKVLRLMARYGEGNGDILVYPFLHYYLGGFVVDVRCRSALPGLFLAGEMVGGLHGRNRLMGNGITDSLVHGWLAGRAARDGTD